MASLIINTGIETHPQISVDTVDFRNGLITFRWVGGPYTGDCAEPFLISLADHGELTLNQMVTAISAAMIANING
jgi:hypothetical protein